MTKRLAPVESLRADETSVVDAVFSALQSMRGAHHVNRALLVMSDGYDNASTQTFGELARLLSDSPVPVFVIVPVDPFSRAGGGPSVPETEIAARTDLSRLANGSGGYLRAVSSKKDMTSAMTTLAATIRSPYVLYFEATGGHADRLGEVTVRIEGVSPTPILLYRGGRRYTQ
jgi:Ca-activated chloride channel family protein